MDAVMHAISDDNRRAVLESLRRGQAAVTELAALHTEVARARRQRKQKEKEKTDD